MFVPLNDAFASFVIIFFCAVILNLSVRYYVCNHITPLKVGNAIKYPQSCEALSEAWREKQHIVHFREEAGRRDLIRQKWTDLRVDVEISTREVDTI